MKLFLLLFHIRFFDILQVYPLDIFAWTLTLICISLFLYLVTGSNIFDIEDLT